VEAGQGDESLVVLHLFSFPSGFGSV
jgi:hypothetical protein